MSGANDWLNLVPAPRPHPQPPPFEEDPIEWDVFISYRSDDRYWAMALRDQLVEAKFNVFLDQFVLRPGLDLAHSLQSHLERSAGGVLVHSQYTKYSQWVDDERAMMRDLRKKRESTPLPFHYVIARIDATVPGFKDQGDLFADFSEHYEDGPRGAEFVRLVHGLVGTRLAEAAVRAIQDAGERTNGILNQIGAAASIPGSFERIAELGSQHAALTPLVPIKAAASLISSANELAALDVIEAGRKEFPKSIRLRQLQGLALRRLKRIDEAQQVLAELYVAGHRDPETMGMFAATFAQRYARSHERADLERSRSLYLDAFALAPNDEYVGINAAAKSAMLGDFDQAREIAGKVGKLMSKYGDGNEYYKSATLAEAFLIAGHYDEAAKLYERTRQRNPQRVGDLAGTLEQVEALIKALGVPSPAAEKLRMAFKSA